ncbi:MAG: hypothetical protein ACIAS6_02800 [Phycisphaerales bacterium JB060]
MTSTRTSTRTDARTIPVDKAGQLDFFEDRIDAWIANAAELGLLASQSAELSSLIDAARSHYDTAQAAKQALKGLFELQDASLLAMTRYGSQLVQTIRAYAVQTGDAQVYATAGLEPRKDPTAIPPYPASNLTYELTTSGALKLTWDGRLSTGTSYILERAFFEPSGGGPGGVGDFEAIAFVDALTHTDNTIPNGTGNILYQVKALKGGVTTNPTAPIFVRFGTGNQQGGQQAVA